MVTPTVQNARRDEPKRRLMTSEIRAGHLAIGIAALAEGLLDRSDEHFRA
jgi:hypothetical protein